MGTEPLSPDERLDEGRALGGRGDFASDSGGRAACKSARSSSGGVIMEGGGGEEGEGGRESTMESKPDTHPRYDVSYTAECMRYLI